MFFGIKTVWLLLSLKVWSFTVSPWSLKHFSLVKSWTITQQLKKKHKNIRTAWQQEFSTTHSRTHPPKDYDCSGFDCSVGGTSSLLQCDAVDVAQPCCTAHCTCTMLLYEVMSHSNCPILWCTVCCFCSPQLCVCVSGSQNFGWGSSAAPRELQGSGTSAMQKSIYSKGLGGREGERDTHTQIET